MQRPALFIALIGLAISAGCGDKKPAPAAQSSTTDAPQFVAIDMGEEDEELESMIGSELMQATADCGNLKKMEPAAMMGKLSDGEIRCLDRTMRDTERQTFKDKLSRVLMADAWAKGNFDRWQVIAKRHLADIDRSDPDLCYKYAKHMSGKGPESAEEALHWANVALENRASWTGDTFTSRVNSLYKLKAVASMRRWQWLEGEYLKDPSDLGLSSKKDARNQAKTLAREWLEYASSAGKDPTTAMQMCISAAGHDDFCRVDDG